ncbi:MAG: S8 family serine peptidase [Patescibacteria group bacterium]
MKKENIFLRLSIFVLGLFVIAQPTFAIVPNDPDFFRQWYLPHIKAPRAWEYTQGSYDIVVAVLDTGVDINHPDLRDNIWVNTSEIPYDQIDNDRNGYTDDFYGWNFLENNNNVIPDVADAEFSAAQHGTIIAGVIGARGANGVGVAGMAWQIKIMPIKVLNNQGNGDASQVARAIDYAVAQGADIINLSFVGSDYSFDLEQAITRAYNQGVVLVAASGNEGEAPKDLAVDAAYPVCYDGAQNMVIGVAALDQFNVLTNFSNYGSKCVDVAAPGVSFYGTQVYDPENDSFSEAYGGGWSGTSVAAPVVSGLAALIKAKNPSLTPAQIRDIIVNSSDSIDALQQNEFKGKVGSGVVNAEASLETAHATLGGNPTSAVNRSYVITGPASQGGPHVRVLDYQGNILSQWFAFESYYRGGVSTASGDVDNDGFVEVITATTNDHVPLIRVFDMNGIIEYEFMAYNPAFRGGVNVAVGDTNGDGIAEIITGAGSGGGPHVRVFNAQGAVQSQFMAYNENFRGGVNVAVGDIAVNGSSEIITAPAADGGAHIRIFSPNGSIASQWFAAPENIKGGFTVMATDMNGDGLTQVVVGNSAGMAPEVGIFDWLGNKQQTLQAYSPNFAGGVRVGSLVYD